MTVDTGIRSSLLELRSETWFSWVIASHRAVDYDKHLLINALLSIPVELWTVDPWSKMTIRKASECRGCKHPLCGSFQRWGDRSASSVHACRLTLGTRVKRWYHPSQLELHLVHGQLAWDSLLFDCLIESQFLDLECSSWGCQSPHYSFRLLQSVHSGAQWSLSLSVMRHPSIYRAPTQVPRPSSEGCQ